MIANHYSGLRIQAKAQPKFKAQSFISGSSYIQPSMVVGQRTKLGNTFKSLKQMGMKCYGMPQN